MNERMKLAKWLSIGKWVLQMVIPILPVMWVWLAPPASAQRESGDGRDVPPRKEKKGEAAPQAPASTAGKAGKSSPQAPLKPFSPSEKIKPGQAVDFPVDI